jgi:hypothetical protein
VAVAVTVGGIVVGARVTAIRVLEAGIVGAVIFGNALLRFGSRSRVDTIRDKINPPKVSKSGVVT